MNINEAWLTLGTDPESVFGFIKAGRNLEEKVKRAEEKLGDARSIAKKLMGTYHPDRNQTDSEAVTRFNRVAEALSVIEKNTIELKQKAESLSEATKKRNLIVIVDKI